MLVKIKKKKETVEKKVEKEREKEKERFFILFYLKEYPEIKSMVMVIAFEKPFK